MSDFGSRLREVFHGKTQREIADILGVSDAAVRNYLGGRVPDVEKLTLIAAFTNCDLHWLLTGSGEKYLAAREQNVRLPESLDEVIDARIRRIVQEELRIQDLGSVDAFDLDAAIGRGESDDEILSGWYESEGRHLPDGFLGVLPKLEPPITAEKRRSLLKDLKKMLDLKLAGNQ